jgi:hypothetical protein
MSLTVPDELVTAAERGHVDDGALLACVRDALPYAYGLVERLASELPAARRDFADNLVPPNEQARGQLLRALASDAIRSALERRFGLVLAFQNCHRLAAFRQRIVPFQARKKTCYNIVK